MHIAITDREFNQFQRFIFEEAGITLNASKKALVSGRLSKRLLSRQLDDFSAYFKLLASGEDHLEVQTAIDLLTTNETYFFREPKHFELLSRLAIDARQRGEPLRAWSAASSSGEEAYSMAMVLSEHLDEGKWEVVGTDISTRVIKRARTGHYTMERARNIPPDYLKRYCLRGMREQEGTLLVERKLRQRVNFQHINLNESLPNNLGQFDVVFLRNVMIYFNNETKRQVVSRVLSLLRPGGMLCIGHSESLNDVTDAVQIVSPSIYRKP